MLVFMSCEQCLTACSHHLVGEALTCDNCGAKNYLRNPKARRKYNCFRELAGWMSFVLFVVVLALVVFALNCFGELCWGLLTRVPFYHG